MTNIHDSGYKVLFSNRTIFRQLMETFVAEDWVKEADFEHAQTLDKSFIADHYKATESDLIYKVPLKDAEVYVYILLEFQSRSERFMALRVLHYLSSFHMDLVKAEGKRRKLPPVFPIVLYNGEARWRAPTRLEELIERVDLPGRFGVQFEYFMIAENAFSRESLLKIRNIVSTLFLAESHYDVDVLTQELLSLFDREADRQAVSLLLNWFRQLAAHGRIDGMDYSALSQAYTNREEVQTMLVKALEREKRQMYEEGKEKGLKEGLKEGKRVIACAMLAEGMETHTVSFFQQEKLRRLKIRPSNPYFLAHDLGRRQKCRAKPIGCLLLVYVLGDLQHQMAQFMGKIKTLAFPGHSATGYDSGGFHLLIRIPGDRRNAIECLMRVDFEYMDIAAFQDINHAGNRIEPEFPSVAKLLGSSFSLIQRCD